MRIPDHLAARSINLLFNVVFAADVPGFQVIRSITGNLGSYLRPPDGYETELAAVSLAQPGASAGTVASIAGLPFVGKLLGKNDSGPLPPVAPDGGPSSGEHADPHPRERWLFVNGICSDQRIALINAEMLARMFGRTVVPLYNATDGWLLDLVECGLGKGFDSVTEAVAKNLMPFVEALCDEALERVVFVSHSQGTIIAAVMLKWLEEVLNRDTVTHGPGAQKPSPERRAARRLTGKEGRDPNYEYAARAHAFALKHLRADFLGKLEMYCFANCATAMNPIVAVGNPVHHAPWIESYGNEYDVVARLGVLAPPHGIGSARIEGDRYRRAKAWGHLLNAHYLIPILRDLAGATDGLKPFPENLLKRPRLWEYYGGAAAPRPYP
jgi:hypothetical protein